VKLLLKMVIDHAAPKPMDPTSSRQRSASNEVPVLRTPHKLLDGAHSGEKTTVKTEHLENGDNGEKVY